MHEGTKKLFILFLVPLLLYLVPLPFIPLMEPDEGRYSAIPAAMNASGDYVTPRLKAAVYFEKPPLVYWATALFFSCSGRMNFLPASFVALCAWGCIILTYRMGIFFHDARTGLFAAAILSTFLYHAAIGRINILDMPLAFFVCLAIWSGFRYFAAVPRRKVWLYLLYLFSALAFLAKGLIGVVFPFGILFIWLIVSGRWRETLALFSPIGMVLFAATALPWLILVQQANPDFFRFFFIQEHLLRYATKMHDRYQPIYFYLPIILAGTLPWCAFLPEAMRGIRWKEVTALFGGTEKRLLLVWIGVILLFFSLSSSKLIPYIAPVFLPLALIFGHIFRRYEDATQESTETALRPDPLSSDGHPAIASLHGRSDCTDIPPRTSGRSGSVVALDCRSTAHPDPASRRSRPTQGEDRERVVHGGLLPLRPLPRFGHLSGGRVPHPLQIRLSPFAGHHGPPSRRGAAVSIRHVPLRNRFLYRDEDPDRRRHRRGDLRKQAASRARSGRPISSAQIRFSQLIRQKETGVLCHRAGQDR